MLLGISSVVALVSMVTSNVSMVTSVVSMVTYCLDSSLVHAVHSVFVTMFTMLVEQQTVINPAVIRGLCAMTKH